MSSEEKISTDANNSSSSKDKKDDENNKMNARGEPEEDRGEDQLVIDEPEEKSDGESDEKEFEPTIDMMMNDFDDEQTMEEEEANSDQTNEEDELAALEQEQDMPIEELLKMYGGGVPTDQETEENAAEDETEDKTNVEIKPPSDSGPTTSAASAKNSNNSATTEAGIKIETQPGEETEESDVPGTKRRGSDSPQPAAKKSKSELARFYEAAVEGRALRSQGSGQAEEGQEEEYEEEIEESDLENRDYSWKKTIMIGPSFQAFVPSDLDAYGDTLPYENEDKQLWNPGHLVSKDVEEYLSKSQEAIQTGGVGSLPMGAHVRDDEQALHLLLQCGYNCEEALRRRRMNAVPTAETMTLWSEEECRSFELGLRLYGKDFHMIQSQKVKTRSVGELIQFYYMWKKTERHDVFANNTRLEKKKYTLHPGTTDYMDRFIDEQDSSRDRSSSPNFYSLMFGGSDGGRKGLSLYPGASSKSSFHLGSESNGSAEPVSNVSNSSPLSTPSATSAPVQNSQSLASPTNGGRFPPLGDEDRDNPSEQTTNQ